MDDPTIEVVNRRLLQQGDPKLIQVWFDPAVLDKYTGSSALTVVRTDSIGRVSRPRVWALDFGIADDESVIHASLSDLLQNLPDGEREHWAAHIVTPPVSVAFLRTRLAPASCIDDGELRPWQRQS